METSTWPGWIFKRLVADQVKRRLGTPQWWWSVLLSKTPRGCWIVVMQGSNHVRKQTKHKLSYHFTVKGMLFHSNSTFSSDNCLCKFYIRYTIYNWMFLRFRQQTRCICIKEGSIPSLYCTHTSRAALEPSVLTEDPTSTTPHHTTHTPSIHPS